MHAESDGPSFERQTDRAHRLVRERVRAGDVVVDATVGNGHDTVFLAGLVGETGTVIGFDVQEAALAKTRGRVPVALRNAVELHGLGHERMTEVVQTPVKAVMCNLGYLPGGDKALITQAETTVSALRQALALLAPGGIVTVVVYTGHEGAREEADAVDEWIERIDRQRHRVVANGRREARKGRPYLVAVERRDSPRP